MEKRFRSKRILAILMSTLVTANSLPVTTFAEETDSVEENQSEAVMENGDTENTEIEESISEGPKVESDELSTEEETDQSDEEIVDSGTCGEDLTWTLDNEGVLIISGTGKMDNYMSINDNSPWYSQRENIVSVIIENGVTKIGDRAFIECSNLINVEISDSVEWIGNDAFYKCSKLTSIDIPSGVTKILSNAFIKCDNLNEINVSEDNKSYCSIDGVLFNYEMTTLVFCPGIARETYTIPEGVTTIETCAFEGNTGLISVEIPNGVTSIGNFAFSGCNNLTGIELPDSVKKIGWDAFEDCNSLTSINIPNGVSKIEQDTFENCSSLTSIELPESITTVCGRVFTGCSNLKDITLKGFAPEFDSYSFLGVTATVHYPDNDISWNEETRQDYQGTLTWEPYETEFIAYSGTCGETVSWTLDRNGLLTISGNGETTNYNWEDVSPWYSRRKYVVSVAIEKGVTGLGKYLFYKCNNMASVEMPEGILSIGNSSFDGCSSLTSIDIPSSVTTIDWYAFSGCSSVTEVTFNGSAPMIGQYSFDDVTANVYYPINDSSWTEKVRQDYGGTLTWKAYTAESKNDSGTCGENVIWTLDSEGTLTISGTGAMQNYSPNSDAQPWSSRREDITTVIIEDGVTSIGEYAFEKCSNLKKINLPDSIECIEVGAFHYCSSLEEVKLPANINDIESEAFLGCSSLKSISIPNGVTDIKYATFSDCYSLENVELPDSMTDIGECAFDNCRSLKNIELPNSVIRIREIAFAGCSGLKSISIPSSVTSIEGWAFYECSNLKEIIFNGSVPKLEEDTFINISATVYYPANDSSWTEEVRQNYGGTLTWVTKESEEKELIITSQPKDFTGNIGDTATFTVGAEGDGVTYQWQYCNSGSSAWKNSTMTGADTDTIEVKITKGRIGQKYRCIVKDSRENKLTSEAAQIVQAEKLTIIEQPESFTGNIGDTATFVIKAKGEGVAYQWQYCSNGSTAWKNSTAAGADTDTLEVKVTKGRIGQKYRCIVKDSKGNKVTSEAAEILKSEKEFAITKQPENASGNIGDTAVFTIGAEGEGITYQWQYCNNGSTAWTNSKMTGSDTDTLEVKITKGRIGQKYRCIVKDSKGKKLISEAAEIIKAEKELVIVQQPGDVVGKVGDKATFTIEAEGEGITYQWQYCSNGSDNWTNSKMTGSDTNTIEVKITKGRIGQKYRCIVKDSKGKKLTSEVVQIIQAEK